MKKLMFILVVVGMTSCSKNCDELEAAAYNKYQQAYYYAGNSPTAIKELQRQYNDEIKRIRENCN
jgi:hypothetical protein